MITSRLKGGLGNQMFQIAAAYGTAKLHNTDMAIDLSIKHHSGQGHPHKKYDDNLYKYIPRFEFKNTEYDMYNEPNFSYDAIPKPIDGRHMILDGYFQTEKYFEHCKEGIKTLFHIPDDIKQGVKEKLDKIKNHFNRDKAVCIHVRRGEYLKLPNIHPVQTKDFFVDAMSQFDYSSVVYVVISDDIDWCVENINYYKTAFCNTGYSYDTEPVTDDLNELFDMYLASQCDGNIISNSSFGWWGAWLNTTDNKVIAPSKWFGPDGPQDHGDVYAREWIKR